MVLVEGVRAVEEVVAAGGRIRFVVVSPSLASTARGERLRELLRGRDVLEVEDDALSRLSDTERPQGVLAVVDEPSVALTDLDPIRLLVLDGVQDPGNLGTLIRSAVAFGMTGVVCLSGTVDPWGTKAVRASAGLVFRIPVAAADHDGLWSLAGEAELPIFVADPSGEPVGDRGGERFVLIVGNEGAGSGPEVLRGATGAVAVEMVGAADSLNVGVAGSILMYALTRGESEMSGVRRGRLAGETNAARVDADA